MIDERGGGTRPELPVVLGGRAAQGTTSRQVPLRTILGSSTRPTRTRRMTLSAWGSVTWTVAVLACATSAFAIRDTMFPTLGRTEPPSAWQAPTRAPASIPYSSREELVPTGTTVPEAAAAADGTPLIVGPAIIDPASAANDDPIAAGPTVATSVNTVDPGAAIAPVVTIHTVNTVPPVSSDVSAPTTTDNVPTTTTGDTVPESGGGNQRGRSPGGSTGDTLP